MFQGNLAKFLIKKINLEYFLDSFEIFKPALCLKLHYEKPIFWSSLPKVL